MLACERALKKKQVVHALVKVAGDLCWALHCVLHLREHTLVREQILVKEHIIVRDHILGRAQLPPLASHLLPVCVCVCNNNDGTLNLRLVPTPCFIFDT